MANTRQQKKVEDGGDQLLQAVKSAVNKLCTSEAFITQLSDSIFTTISENINKELDVVRHNMGVLEDRVQRQDTVNKSFAECHERYEQFIRKNNILVYGLKENANQNCLATILEIFNGKMKLNIKESEIESCYRVGKVNVQKHRPVMVKFINAYFKQLVFSSKKVLKNTKIVIREDLTVAQSRLLKSALGKVGKNGKVWTNYGTIFVKYTNDETVQKILSLEDLN